MEAKIGKRFVFAGPETNTAGKGIGPALQAQAIDHGVIAVLDQQSGTVIGCVPNCDITDGNPVTRADGDRGLTRRVIEDADVVQRHVARVRDFEWGSTALCSDVAHGQIGVAASLIGGPNSMSTINRIDILDQDIAVNLLWSAMVL